MEPIFENVYTDTEEMFREQYNRSGWVMRAVWVAVFLCLIVYYGIVLLTEQSLFYLLIVSFSILDLDLLVPFSCFSSMSLRRYTEVQASL